MITTIQEKNCSRSKKKQTSLTLKILKSLVDAPCNTRTIRRHLNNEKIKHKKRIQRPRLTKKHKKKRLEYARQYRTIDFKELRKVFSDEKKFKLAGLDDFQKYWHAKNVPDEKYSTKHGGISLIIWGVVLNFRKAYSTICQWLKKAVDYVKMLNDLSLAKEGRRLCGKELIFQKITLLSPMHQ